jgi:hypothetical protein
MATRGSAADAPAETLQVRQRPVVGWLVVAVVVAAAAAGGSWFATHPQDLETSDRTVEAMTPAGQPVYLGVFEPTGFDRTLHLSGVKVHSTSTVQVEVVPLLCHDGTIGVTSDPATFCSALVNPEGESFGPGDSIVLKVTGESAGAAAIDRVRLGYREGFQAATQEAGEPSVVTIIAR